jgi:hypothetical protein
MPSESVGRSGADASARNHSDTDALDAAAVQFGGSKPLARRWLASRPHIPASEGRNCATCGDAEEGEALYCRLDDFYCAACAAESYGFDEGEAPAMAELIGMVLDVIGENADQIIARNLARGAVLAGEIHAARARQRGIKRRLLILADEAPRLRGRGGALPRLGVTAPWLEE